MSVTPPPVGEIVHGENLEFVRTLPDGLAQLIYLDPPFNTGRSRRRQPLRTIRDDEGDRIGFGGHRYRTERLGEASGYRDRFDDYLGFLEPRLREAKRLLAHDGSLYVHLDYREVHYVKVLLDEIFGRECFVNEVIWAWDFGARSKRRWPTKHDNILFYAKDPEAYFFDIEAVERIPYMAPTLVGPQKAARGKLPTDTWWHTIVSPTGKEKTGYPTQKPLGVIERIVKASSRPDDLVLDFFAGSGTTGAAALKHGRRFLLVDENPAAIEVMGKRFADRSDVLIRRHP